MAEYRNLWRFKLRQTIMDNIDWKYCKFSLWIISFVVYRECRNLWWFTLRQTIIDSIDWKYCKFNLWIISFVVFRWYERLFPFLHIKFTICHIVWHNLLWFHQFGILSIVFFFWLAHSFMLIQILFVYSQASSICIYVLQLVNAILCAC